MPYYYQQLNKDQQRAYYAIKEGLTGLKESFPVPRLSGRELTDIYFLLRLDHPEIFYTVSFRYKYYEDSDNLILMPDYMFDRKKIMEHQKALDSRIQRLARQAEGLNEEEKELFIHDFICQNIIYDKLKKNYSHEIIGALGQGIAVCEGISKAVKVLCDRLGIWCIVVISEAAPDKNIRYRHAWNVVRIGGKYYHLDATFDNSLKRDGLVRYDYVNLCDRQIFRDHQPVIWKIPACEDGSGSYYQGKKLSFTKLEDVRKRAAQAVKKKKTLVFHWRGGYFTREIFGEILSVIQEEAAAKEKYAAVSVNWAQAVVQVSFYDDVSSEKVEMQEASAE